MRSEHSIISAGGIPSGDSSAALVADPSYVGNPGKNAFCGAKFATKPLCFWPVSVRDNAQSRYSPKVTKTEEVKPHVISGETTMLREMSGICKVQRPSAKNCQAEGEESVPLGWVEGWNCRSSEGLPFALHVLHFTNQEHSDF